MRLYARLHEGTGVGTGGRIRHFVPPNMERLPD